MYPTGITLSPAQVKRATELAKERGLDNVHFQVSTLFGASELVDFADWKMQT